MYTSYIGKNFLKIYNKREGKKLSSEEFFNQIFFELFFRDNSHLMHVGNSPFFQKPKADDVAKHGSKSLAQLNNLKDAIANDTPNMSIYVGGSAKDLGGTTSGQVTDIDFLIDQEEMYASWIGEALGIGVNGGFVMLIDDPEILWALYEGWMFYRKYLSQTPSVKDKQIETWNGQWICHYLQAKIDGEKIGENLNIETTEVQGNIAIPTQQWVRVIFALSKKFPNRVITIYGYNLSQTNTTLGFINIYLPEVKKMFELRDKLFLKESETILSDAEIEKYATFFNFKSACQMGTIGLKSLEPAGIREFMPKGTVAYAQGKEFKFSIKESFFNYQLYKIWITAMLNKIDLLNLASEVSSALIELETKDERGKKVFATLSQELRDSKNVKDFIEKISAVLIQQPSNKMIFRKVVEELLNMPSDNFPLFVTLIRFEYSFQKN